MKRTHTHMDGPSPPHSPARPAPSPPTAMSSPEVRFLPGELASPATPAVAIPAMRSPHYAPHQGSVSLAASPVRSASPASSAATEMADDDAMHLLVSSAAAAGHSILWAAGDDIAQLAPATKAATDRVLALLDAPDDAVELAKSLVATDPLLPMPHLVLLAGASVAHRAAGSAATLADRDRVSSLVAAAITTRGATALGRDDWLATAVFVERHFVSVLVASLVAQHAVGDAGLSEDELSADAELCIERSAVHVARAVLHAATTTHPHSVRLWKQSIAFETTHGGHDSLSHVTTRAGALCPAALNDDEDEDDPFGQSVTISNNPTFASRSLYTNFDDGDDSDDMFSDARNAPTLGSMSASAAAAAAAFFPASPTSPPGYTLIGDASAASNTSAAAAAAASRFNSGPSNASMFHTTSYTSSSSAGPSSSSSAAAALAAERRAQLPTVAAGLKGLQNLGNTCFMNSALQCMSNTPFLNLDYFNRGAWVHEVNPDNPLGTQGAMSKAYAALMKAMWTPSTDRSIAPRHFKAAMAQFAPQFSGYAQHDSQELLGFLLDGLHEDLNRVRSKPYIEAKDDDGRPDAEVAAEQWAGHRARNDSIIVDLFQGQYKSRVQCATCGGVSVTFDPFMVLTLPIPCEAALAPVRVIAIPLDPNRLPVRTVAYVKRDGGMGELASTVAKHVFATGAEGEATPRAAVVEVWNHKIHRVYRDLEPVAEIAAGDVILVLELPPDGEVPAGYPMCGEIAAVVPAVEKEEDEKPAGETADQVMAETPAPVTEVENGSASPMQVDSAPATADAAETPAPTAAPKEAEEPAKFVPVFLCHSKLSFAAAAAFEAESSTSSSTSTTTSFYPSYRRGPSATDFGEPTLAFFRTPFDPAQAHAAIVATMKRWTTFPWDAYRAAHPDADVAQFVKVQAAPAGRTYRATATDLVAGAAIAPLQSINVVWDESVAEVAFAEEKKAAAFGARPVAGVGSSSSTSLGFVSAASSTAVLLGNSSENLGPSTSGDVEMAETPAATAAAADTSVDPWAATSLDDAAPAAPATADAESAAPAAPAFTGTALWSKTLDGGAINAPKLGASTKPDAYTLDQCLDAFVADEHLGASDPVYCRKCKEHREASKKVDLWRLPQVLVVALKRFGQGGRYRREKIDVLVDCPRVLDLHGRALDPALAEGDGVYELYAVTNHYGGIGGGHYTAYAHSLGDHQWYEFDDSRVSPVSADDVITRASYVLFYRRRGGVHCAIPEPVAPVTDEAKIRDLTEQDPEDGWGSSANKRASWLSGGSSSGFGSASRASSSAGALVPFSGAGSSLISTAAPTTTTTTTVGFNTIESLSEKSKLARDLGIGGSPVLGPSLPDNDMIVVVKDSTPAAAAAIDQDDMDIERDLERDLLRVDDDGPAGLVLGPAAPADNEA
ncbi:hypothetical protein H9P43_007236 [Blastocladiella emersonii ATCC 22665]|nr:hypothetical protein H9P43_007236 [Blastocladiella emersonii ATCC 22665]